MPKSLLQLLDEHERDILMRIDPIRKELASLERDLADVRKARNALTPEHERPPPRGLMARIVAVGDMRQMTPRYHGGGEMRDLSPPPSPYDKLTIKQLVRKALDEHFTNGATANELLDFFRDAWGRNDIMRTSLSPQLSRLKRDGVITLHGMKWHLVGLAPDHNENGAPATLPLDAPEPDGAASPSNHQPQTTNG